ncbi:hypothetical protein AB7160_00235 [Morganella morganii]|uniref:hypothetical protein n=1 Tax=Morganella morganii TaxID=582 RepID=UPI0034E617AC
MSYQYFLLDSDGSIKIYERDVIDTVITIKDTEIQPVGYRTPKNEFFTLMHKINDNIYMVLDTIAFNTLPDDIKEKIILESGCRPISS